MPTYEYRCPDGHEFEHFYRKISDSVPELPCPECGKLATRRLSGGAGLVFKGSGFYLTDYGKNAHANKGPKPSSPDGAKSESSSSADTKSSTDTAASSTGASSGSGQPSSGSSTSSSSGGESAGGSGTAKKAKPGSE